MAETPAERRALAVFFESAGWSPDLSATIAVALFEEFGSLGAIASGSARRLKRVAGKGGARLLLAHSELLRCRDIELIAARPVLANRDALYTFLRQEIGFSPTECLLALFVDARVGLIKVELVAVGTVSSIVVDPFPLFQRGKELGASGIILAHNHPSRDTAASNADILVTNRLKRIGAELDIPLLDHFIVAPGQITPVPII